MKDDLLYKIADSMPYLQELVSSDFCAAIYDLEKCIASFKGRTIDLGVKKGDEIKAGGATLEAIDKNEKIVKEVSKEVYGIPYIGRAIPIVNSDNEVIGAVATGESIEKKDKVLEMAQKLSSAMEEITASIQEVASGTDRVSELGHNLADISKDNLKNVQQTDEVINFIYSLAKQTKMLGLNASIEAVRAGNEGKGFQVVADEVGKLAESSATSTKKINEILEKIKASNNEATDKSYEISEILEQLAASNQEISSSIQSLTHLSEELLKMAQDLD